MKNDHRSHFTIYLLKSYVGEVGFKYVIPGFADMPLSALWSRVPVNTPFSNKTYVSYFSIIMSFHNVLSWEIKKKYFSAYPSYLHIFNIFVQIQHLFITLLPRSKAKLALAKQSCFIQLNNHAVSNQKCIDYIVIFLYNLYILISLKKCCIQT